MLPSKTIWCHRTGFEKTCFEMVTQKECRLWQQIQGMHPQTEEVISKWDCVDVHMFTLSLQNGLQQDRMIASTDKIATEVKAHRDEDATMGAIIVQRARNAVHEAIVGPIVPGLPMLGRDAD